MKKTFLKIVVVILFMIITMSFIVEDMVVQTFSQEILAKKIAGYFLDQIINEVPTEQLGKIEQNIRNSKRTKKITSKFIKTIINNCMKQKETKLEIEEEIDWIIAEEITKEASPQKLKEIKLYVIEQITNTEKRLEDNLLESFGEYYFIILKTYDIVTNIYFRIISILLGIIIGIHLVLLEKHKVWKTLKICSFALTIGSLSIFIILKLMSNFIDQNLAGGWLEIIHMDSLIGLIMIEIIFSILCMIVESKVNLKIYSKE